LNMTWAPMVDVSRDPRWGRASEGFGEDTYLTTMVGQAMVASMQGKSPADRYAVRSSVKHFVAYGGVEGGQEYNTVDMSPPSLFNEDMPPYKGGLDVGRRASVVGQHLLDGTP
ncbi:beta-glucosidase, partial [Klebsiella pneumoniae]|uniref:glycoside hydrolase family 3 N-terminal domain-containing protein n=1 Tax=Klebsiella pneumoniae TaxID=573 RepID=UPI00102588B9